jgi:hypothetical protein
MKTKTKLAKVKNIVCIGDTHFGSSIALMPPLIRVQDGLVLTQSRQQVMLWQWWLDFWQFVDAVLDGEPFILVHNGDIVDGNHHGCTQLATGSISAQQSMAISALRSHVARAAAFYCIAGTAAHAGQSSSHEEQIANALGAIPDHDGRHCRQDLWIEMGRDLVQFAHHIGTTSSAAYKSSAIMRMIAGMQQAAGEWGFRPPTVMVRSHAHDYTEVKRPNCRGVICPAWQLKSDWVWGKDTTNLPIIGGLILREGKEGLHIREFVRTPRPSPTVAL